MPVQPTTEQLKRLTSSTDTQPVVMLNLLRFKDEADGIDEGMSGAEAYARYGAETEPFLQAVGGRVLMAVQPQQSVVGPIDGEWDLVILVEYPSRQKFMEMATNPEYIKVHAHREAALEDARLIACSKLNESDLSNL